MSVDKHILHNTSAAQNYTHLELLQKKFHPLYKGRRPPVIRKNEVYEILKQMSNEGHIIPTVFKDGIPLFMTIICIVIYISIIYHFEYKELRKN
jgi:hypothetical protein